MKKHLLAIAFAFVAFLGVNPAVNVASASPVKSFTAFDKTTSITQPITGTILGGGTFNGTLSITKFVSQGGQLYAVGTITGTLTNALGTLIGSVTNFAVKLPTTASGSCQILHLELGPLDLDLLGLQVHLDKVVLDITAQSGPGNLLGNLLCAVANLLNGQGSLSSLAKLLNQILGIVTI
jgi:hypothetical protein